MTETYLFTDTETTGFKKQGNLIQKDQARVCQSAMILTDFNGRKLGEFSSLIKPDGWVISAGAFKCNGIKMEDCYQHGISQSAFIHTWELFASRATHIVAHNEKFDREMMEIETAYAGGANDNTTWLCTMISNTHLHGGKSLKNCVRHYLGREPSKAHDAMGDTIDCMEVFFAMRGIQL